MLADFKQPAERECIMAGTTKNESLYVSIDKTSNVASWSKLKGNKSAVTFHSDEDCVLHFSDPAVFGFESLPLTHDVLRTEPVVASGKTTEVTFSLSGAGPSAALVAAVPARKPWPILP
jgi:hypothetical protein